MDILCRYRNNQDQSPSDHGKIVNVSYALIQCCYWKYGRQWNRHQDDGYFYQYIMEHAIDAEASSTISNLINDIEWIESKLRATKTISSIYLDIKYCESYLRVKVSYFTML